MVKVPRSGSGATPTARPQGTNVSPSDSEAVRRNVGQELTVARVDTEGRSSTGHRAGLLDEGVQLDAAIDAALATPDIDPVTRVNLDEASVAIRSVEARRQFEGFAGETLADALFRFVMPRLRHPEVLHAERHRAILEQLAHDLSRLPSDGVVREGAVAVHRELRKLAILRQGRNSIIEG